MHMNNWSAIAAIGSVVALFGSAGVAFVVNRTRRRTLEITRLSALVAIKPTIDIFHDQFQSLRRHLGLD